MKRFSKILVAICVCLCFGVIMYGCEKVTIVSGELKATTISTTIVRGEELDTSEAVAVIKYSDDTKIEVGADELSFGAIDSSTVGDKTLTVTYKEFTFNVTIKVVATEADVNAIASLRSELLTEFVNNRGATGQLESFYDKEQPLYVGENNPFDFRITAGGVDGAGNLVTNLTKVRTIVTVEIKGEGDSFSVLEGDALTDMVEIDTENTTFDFTPAAIGKEFKVTVAAANRDEEYAESDTKFTASNLVVVDAFNVYTAKELSVYDNLNRTDSRDIGGNGIWTDIKTEIGVNNLTIDGIVLQDDIRVLKEDVPDYYFWRTTDIGFAQAQAVTDQPLEGSLRDEYDMALYERDIVSGDTFNFIGNYFQIDFSAFPKIVSAGITGTLGGVNEAEGAQAYITAHMSVFRTEPKAGTVIDGETQVNWKNISFYGNGTLDSKPTTSGAVLLMKNVTVNFEAYNTLTNNFSIGYFLELGEAANPYDGNYLIDSCKGYNSYNTHFYTVGVEKLLIKDSEFMYCGGPAMINNHLDPEHDGVDAMPSNIDVIHSTIESRVGGTEPWFTTFQGASSFVALLSGMDELFDGSNPPLQDTGKTIIADTVQDGDNPITLMNVVAVFKDSEAEGITSQRIGGYMRIFETEEEYNAFYGIGVSEDKSKNFGLELDDSIKNYEGTDNLSAKAMGTGLVYLQSNGSGGYIGAMEGQMPDTSLTKTGIPYSEGKYLNIYLHNGMGVIIQLYDAA